VAGDAHSQLINTTLSKILFTDWYYTIFLNGHQQAYSALLQVCSIKGYILHEQNDHHNNKLYLRSKHYSIPHQFFIEFWYSNNSMAIVHAEDHF
jgi:hypothetical protein